MDLYLNRPVINGTLKWTSRYLNPSVDQPVLNLFVYFDFKTVKRPSARLSALRLKKDLRELKQNINSWRHRDIIGTSSLRHCDVIQKSAQINPTLRLNLKLKFIFLQSVLSICQMKSRHPINHAMAIFIFVHLVKNSQWLLIDFKINFSKNLRVVRSLIKMICRI